jgi:hypothetical protein
MDIVKHGAVDSSDVIAKHHWTTEEYMSELNCRLYFFKVEGRMVL